MAKRRNLKRNKKQFDINKDIEQHNGRQVLNGKLIAVDGYIQKEE